MIIKEPSRSPSQSSSILLGSEASVEARLDQLCRVVTELRAENAELRAENAELRAENAELKKLLIASDSARHNLEVQLCETAANLKESKQRAEQLEEKVEDLQSTLASVTIDLRKARGYIKSSEKGPSIDGSPKGDNADNPPPPSKKRVLSNKFRYKALGRIFRELKKIRIRAEKNAGFVAKTMSRQKWLRDHGSNPGLIPVCEDMMRSQLVEKIEQTMKVGVGMEQKLERFSKTTGLSTSIDRPSRWDFRITVTDLTCEHETVTDPETGKSFRAGELEFGPKGYKITWRALTNLCLMVAEYAIPMERIARMLGIAYFSSSNISRWMQMVAEKLLPIYLLKFKRLAECKFLRMDDTTALVLAMRDHAAQEDFCADADMTGEEFEDELDEMEEKAVQNNKSNLIAPLARVMGRVAQYADGKGGKKGINLTLISGQPDEKDSRSTIFFFRTHFGQAGNLVSRVLEQRKQKDTFKVFIQSDRSKQNNIEKRISERVTVIYVGCYAHARRPFAKFVKDDEDLCYYMLRAFLLIAHLEEQAFSAQISRERILRFRRKERFVWRIIKDVCEQIIAGKIHIHAKNKIWKKKSSLHTAAQYVLIHYEALTIYLDYPELFAENNCMERNLRMEKLIEDAAKFRSAEEGRIALDIIRSFIATCRAAEVDFETYLTGILKLPADVIEAHPENFLPIAFAKALH